MQDKKVLHRVINNYAPFFVEKVEMHLLKWHEYAAFLKSYQHFVHNSLCITCA